MGGDFSVTTALSGQEGIGILSSRKIDAVVSDYQMPKMDGIMFLSLIRRDHPRLPFIIFTGKGREEIVIEAYEKGADFYVQKGGEPKSQFTDLARKIQMVVSHRTAEAQIANLNRLFSVLSATNKAIVHIRGRGELLSEICRIFVDVGGFKMAWIGRPDAEQGIIEPVSSAGDTGYLKELTVLSRDEPWGGGLTGTAYKTGAFVVNNDLESDPSGDPWRDTAVKHGFRASASFPVAPGTRHEYVLTLHATTQGFFAGPIIDLLHEVSGDIAFALELADAEEKRVVAEENLVENEKRLSLTLDASNDGIWDWHIPSGTAVFSPRYYTMLGYEPGELPACYETFRSLVYPDDIRRVADAQSDHIDSLEESYSIEFRMRRKDGRWAWILSRGKVVERDTKGQAIRMMGAHTDITPIKELEEEAVRRNEKLVAAYEELEAHEEELLGNYEMLKERDRELSASEDKFRSLFTSMAEGVALHEMVYDDENRPVDYRIVEVNPMFESHTGIPVARARCALASELYGTGKPPFLDVYARVAGSGNPESITTYFEKLHRHFLISVFSPKKGWFGTVFTDITETVTKK